MVETGNSGSDFHRTIPTPTGKICQFRDAGNPQARYELSEYSNLIFFQKSIDTSPSMVYTVFRFKIRLWEGAPIMANAGYKAESTLLEEISSSGVAKFNKLDGTTVEIPVSGSILTFGFSTRTKVDMVINGNYRLQIKCAGTKRSAVLNMVPARLLERAGREQLLDVEPCYKAMEIVSSSSASTIKLSEYFDIEDWREIISYFLFEGTATGQADKHFQSNYLLEIDGGRRTLIEKQEAVPYIWKGLTAEIRTRKGKIEPCLHVRYSA